MTKFYLFKILRYIAAAIGGVMLYEGNFDPQQLELYMGVIAAVGALTTSVYQSKRRISQGNQNV